MSSKELDVLLDTQCSLSLIHLTNIIRQRIKQRCEKAGIEFGGDGFLHQLVEWEQKNQIFHKHV